MEDSYRVLVVDDSAFVRKIVTGHFEETEFEVVAEAENGAEAITQFDSCKPDLVLLDIIMPDKTGEEALAEIMQRDPTAAVMMLSSLGTEEMVTQCMENGARSFLQKPFDKDALLSQAREIVTR